jgi:hypothetical protein
MKSKQILFNYDVEVPCLVYVTVSLYSTNTKEAQSVLYQVASSTRL